MANKEFRIVAYNNKTYNVKPISYFDTYNEAEQELIKMSKNNECQKDLMYFIQSRQPVPVKTPEERNDFLKLIREFQEGKDIAKLNRKARRHRDKKRRNI